MINKIILTIVYSTMILWGVTYVVVSLLDYKDLLLRLQLAGFVLLAIGMVDHGLYCLSDIYETVEDDEEGEYIR